MEGLSPVSGEDVYHSLPVSRPHYPVFVPPASPVVNRMGFGGMEVWAGYRVCTIRIGGAWSGLPWVKILAFRVQSWMFLMANTATHPNHLSSLQRQNSSAAPMVLRAGSFLCFLVKRILRSGSSCGLAGSFSTPCWKVNTWEKMLFGLKSFVILLFPLST